MLHSLLLNGTYECISFLPERRVYKLLALGKVEVLEQWDNKVQFGRDNYIKFPAVIKLKHHVRWIPRKVRFNRLGVFKRDNYTCCYCSKMVRLNDLTIDHVIPRDKGGENSWRNCVAACFTCNNKKSNRTPDEAGMPLLKKPIMPQLSIYGEFSVMQQKHDSWRNYLGESR